MKGLTIVACVFSFLVSWKVSEWKPAPCPGYGIETINEYTGNVGMSMVSCAVLHGERIVHLKYKVFDTKIMAEEFVRKAPGKHTWIMSTYPYDFKITEQEKEE